MILQKKCKMVDKLNKNRRILITNGIAMIYDG